MAGENILQARLLLQLVQEKNPEIVTNLRHLTQLLLSFHQLPHNHFHRNKLASLEATLVRN